MNTLQATRMRLPGWMRKRLPAVSSEKTHQVLADHRLHTVCESAECPNRSECYSRHTATFMILGDVCTRRCGFCAIATGRPQTVKPDEPRRVAEAARALGLRYVVITSVARDELADEGAGHFARTIEAVREGIPEAAIEVLTPDFHAREDLIQTVVRARPTVYNHNLETVERLQACVRPQGSYARTLKVLETVKRLSPERLTKSGLMLGLGETQGEVVRAVHDLRSSGCDILTLGQYLAPSRHHLPVAEYVSPVTFQGYREEFLKLGFREVFSGPYVRSSYHAGETFQDAKIAFQEKSV